MATTSKTQTLMEFQSSNLLESLFIVKLVKALLEITAFQKSPEPNEIEVAVKVEAGSDII
jgi:hypothetical protein